MVASKICLASKIQLLLEAFKCLVLECCKDTARSPENYNNSNLPTQWYKMMSILLVFFQKKS